MSNKDQIVKWLKSIRSELSWLRVSGDKSPIEIDSLYINRQEGYEIAELMY